MEFYENLKRLMKDKQMSQVALAKELNTTQQTVSRWGNGVNEPDYHTLLIICKILDTTPNELLGWED